MRQEECTFQGGAGVQPPGEAEDLYGVERQTDTLRLMQCRSQHVPCVVMAGVGMGVHVSWGVWECVGMTVDENVCKSPTCPPGVGPVPVVRGSQVAMSPSPQVLEKPGPLWRHSCLQGGVVVRGVQSHTAASQAAGVMLGQWCQVPGGGPSLHSPLRAFVGSSDKLVRGAGRRPPPNRLSQKGEGNEGWVGGRLQIQQLCGKGGRGRPNPKEVRPPGPSQMVPLPQAPGGTLD